MVCAADGGALADPGPAGLDDSTLVSLARSGDQRALEVLCHRNWRPVYRSFARYTSDSAEAEDLTQEVFLRALRAFPRFTDKGVPYTAYLLQIAANLARDRWRAGPSRVVPVGDVPEQPSLGPGPEGLALASDRTAALLSALDQLGRDQRMVLKLRVLDGRSTAEVAAMTNRSQAAVRQLQVRALAALRAALRDWVAIVRVESSLLSTASLINVDAGSIRRSTIRLSLRTPPLAAGASTRTCWSSGWQRAGFCPGPQVWSPRNASSRPSEPAPLSKPSRLPGLLLAG
jgi:RNA polymerase sigma-70 factor (ECF subfamily)